SYSRRTGARLALAIAEPHTGDFLVKLKHDHKRSTEEVLEELRRKFHTSIPAMDWDMHGILGDLIGDLTWSPKPIEIKLISPDLAWLKQKAPEIEGKIRGVRGVVDTFDGLMATGNAVNLRLRDEDARRYGLTTKDVATAVETALLGRTASAVLEGDRVIPIRTLVDKLRTGTIAAISNLPITTSNGSVVKLSQ